MKKNILTMTDNELLEELGLQAEWAKDDAFEYSAFSRGDNGFARDDCVAKLYDEGVRRGLCEPLPVAPEDDPDFDRIKKHMEAQGFEWCGVAFRKWGHVAGMTGRRQVDYCSFEDAAAEWHRA